MCCHCAKGFKVELMRPAWTTRADSYRSERRSFLAESETGKIKVFRGVGPDAGCAGFGLR